MANGVIGVGDEGEFEFSTHVGGDFFKVAAVAGGEEDAGDTGAGGGEDFFFDAADGHDFAAEGDFAGHGGGGRDGLAIEEGIDGDEHGEAGGGAVLGDGAGGDVDVDVGFFVEGVGEVEASGVGLEIAEGGAGGFLHDVAEGTGEDEVAFAGHAGGFNEEDVAADGGPGESGDDAGVEVFFGDFGVEFDGAEEGGKFGGGYAEGGFAAFGEVAGGLAADVGDFAVEVADAGFAGVVGDDAGEGVFGKGNLGGGEAVGV